MTVNPLPHTSIDADDMTAEQLALPTSQRVKAYTRFGTITGGRTKNGCQVFLNVPYGLDVPRFSDPHALPNDYRYSEDPFVVDGKYCSQPKRPDQDAEPMPDRQRYGLGHPTDNPFFADIYIPSTTDLSLSRSISAPSHPKLPVRVFFHGGFLQFGSTSGTGYNQQFFYPEQWNEVRVLLGYRVSALGFLASESPKLEGNYGFKDAWLGLEWVRDNIASFGGDPENVHISGLSGGGHLVHQMLHRAAQLAPAKAMSATVARCASCFATISHRASPSPWPSPRFLRDFADTAPPHAHPANSLQAPFITCTLLSNAILSDPCTPSSRAPQFSLLCKSLHLDPSAPDVLDRLRDPSQVPSHRLTQVIEGMGFENTFRGVVGSDGWIRSDQMGYQQSGGLGRDLKRAGVGCVIMGDVKDEDAWYTGYHTCANRDEILPNLKRYYLPHVAQAIFDAYPRLAENATSEEATVQLGRIISDGQVHLPVRLLARDLVNGGMPVVRYSIEKVTKASRSDGKVAHGTDMVFQHFRLSMMDPGETLAAIDFHTARETEVAKALAFSGSGSSVLGRFEQHGEDEMLMLCEAGRTGWEKDWRWDGLRKLERAVRGGTDGTAE